MSAERFDTIVVGGGAAGCVLANRLSADPAHRVLVLEAGPDFGHTDEGRWPRALTSAAYAPTPYDWDYTVAVGGQRLRYTRGKVMGGSSAVNATGVSWGLRQDYDAWAARGNPGWDFDGLLPFFQRVERLENDSAPLRGQAGMLTVTRSDSRSPFLDAARVAFSAAGCHEVADISGPDAMRGVGSGTRNRRGDERFHAARAYLDPVRSRPNLTIRDRTTVDRLVWTDDVAHGVVAWRDDQPVDYAADRIVLTAGAIGDPLILHRSGIGPPELLRRTLGPTAAIHALPGVGANLRDHFGARMAWRLAPDFAARLRSADPALAPDGRWVLSARIAADPTDPAYNVTMSLAHDASRPPDGLLRANVFLVRLRATGSVTIASDNRWTPRIDPGFGLPEDLAALAQAVTWVRDRFAHPSLRDWIEAEALPGESVTGDALREWIGQNIALYYHPVGTCAMGPAGDPNAVVDHTGKLHGFRNVYVADAAVMPSIPRGMIIMSVYAVAEKIAAGLTAR